MIFLESFRTTWSIFSIYKVLVFLSSGQGLPTPEQLAMKRESIVVLPGLTNTIDKKENRKDKKGNTNKILKLKLNWFFQLGQMKSIDSTLLYEPITKMDSVARKWIGCYLSVCDLLMYTICISVLCVSQEGLIHISIPSAE